MSSGQNGKAQPWVAWVSEASGRMGQLENHGFLTEAEAGSERVRGPHSLCLAQQVGSGAALVTSSG